MRYVTGLYPRVRVDVAKSGAVVQPGGVLLTETVRASGLDVSLRDELDRFTRFGARHHLGKIVTDLAITLALGEDDLAGAGLIRDEPRVYGPVASHATLSRRVADLAAGGDAVLRAIRKAHSAARARVWNLAGDRAPGTGRTAANPLIIDLDATLVTSHSDKELAAGTWKGGFGFHPMCAFIDHGPGGAGETAALLLRPGNAGSNTAADHIGVTKAALAQVPGFTGRSRADRTIMVRTDTAGGTKAFVNWLAKHRFSYSLGFPITDEVTEAIETISTGFNENTDSFGVWEPAVDGDGEVRDGAWVTELTGLLPKLTEQGWPPGMRVIVRRERPHPGAQSGLFDVDGYRHHAFITNTPTSFKAAGGNVRLATLELRHRRRARAEDRVRCGKQTGLGRLPLQGFAQNQIWLQLVALATDLITWAQMLALHGTDAANWEPKRLRVRLFSIPATIARGARRLTLHLAEHSRWSTLIHASITRLRGLPAPT